MPNTFESLKAQRNAAKAAEEAAEKKRLELEMQQECIKFLPIIKEKQRIEEGKRIIFDQLAPIITKVLHDLGSVLGDEYRVENASWTESYELDGWHGESCRDESGNYQGMPSYTTYAWSLGRTAYYSGFGQGQNFGGGHISTFDTHYSVRLVFSDNQLLFAECVNHHSGVFVKKSLFSSEWVEKPVAPVACGFSEDEIANTLHRLYTDRQA